MFAYAGGNGKQCSPDVMLSGVILKKGIGEMEGGGAAHRLRGVMDAAVQRDSGSCRNSKTTSHRSYTHTQHTPGLHFGRSSGLLEKLLDTVKNKEMGTDLSQI